MRNQTVFFIMIVLLVSAFGAKAQTISRQVLAAGGSSASSGELMLSWTMGQPGPVEMAVAPSAIINQGFQQGDEPYVGITEQPVDDGLVKIYPNPSNGIFFLEGKIDGPAVLKYEIHDVQGRKADGGEICVAADGLVTAQFDISEFAPGIYLLCLYSGGTLQPVLTSFTLSLTK